MDLSPPGLKPKSLHFAFCLSNRRLGKKMRVPFRLPTVAAILEENDPRDSRVDYAGLA
jgi:hypothetical protein